MGKASPEKNIAVEMKKTGQATVVLGDAHSFTESVKTGAKSNKDYKPFDQSCHNSKTYRSTLFKDVPLSVEPLPPTKPARKISQNSQISGSKANVFVNTGKGVEADATMGDIKVAQRALKRPTTGEICNLKSVSDLVHAEDKSNFSPSRPPSRPHKKLSSNDSMKFVINAVKPDPPKRVGIPPGGHSTLVFNWV